MMLRPNLILYQFQDSTKYTKANLIMIWQENLDHVVVIRHSIQEHAGHQNIITNEVQALSNVIDAEINPTPT